MKEEYLHHLFQQKSLGNQFITTTGKPLEILYFGDYNTDAGPDFSNVKIRFDDNVWIGPLEFHVRSSDWFRHNHQHDPKYDNVIAHFVYDHDKEIELGQFTLPTVELKSKIDLENYVQYEKLVTNKSEIPCHSFLEDLNDKLLLDQFEFALTHRLERKSGEIIKDIKVLKGDRTKAFYFSLARIFGGKVNNLPFEKLISKFDMRWPAKLNYEQTRIEALLFGMSGLLPIETEDEYVIELKSEFEYLRKLFDLSPLDPVEWKYSRMRPFNFPPIKIAQFASLISAQINLSELTKPDLILSELNSLFNVDLHPFWNNHFRFEHPTKIKKVNLSDNFLSLVYINAVAPFIYAVGSLESKSEHHAKALKLLKEISPENNKIIDLWKAYCIKSNSAYDSQALIETKNEFCNRKKCLICKIGQDVLNK